MLVSFLHVGDDLSLAKIMVASAKRHIPNARLLMMTDSAEQRIDGCDLQVLPYDGERLMTYRVRHLAARDEPMIVLDTDVVVQDDLSHVFVKRFDVALTKRDGVLMHNGQNIVKIMPYNTGVMFSRCRAFWQECLETLESAPENIQRWWGDQLAVRMAAESGRYRVLELPVAKYNYSPSSESEDVSNRLAVHYKGRRKQWMMNRGP